MGFSDILTIQREIKKIARGRVEPERSRACLHIVRPSGEKSIPFEMPMSWKIAVARPDSVSYLQGKPPEHDSSNHQRKDE